MFSTSLISARRQPRCSAPASVLPYEPPPRICVVNNWGWNPKKLFQLVTDRDTRGFKGVHGGPVNEHVGRLGETNTVQEILKRAGVKIRRSNFRNWAA